MAWTTPGTAVAGEVLEAAFWNEQVRDNMLIGNPIFADEAARDAAIPSPVEGQRCYLTAPTIPAATGALTLVPSGVQTIYNGSVWVCVTDIGARSNINATTTSTSYVTTLTSDTTPLSVTLVTGTTALIDLFATAVDLNNYVWQSVSVSGATTLAANDDNAAQFYWFGVAAGISYGRRFIISGLTAGTNTFTMNYKVSGGTGSFEERAFTVKGIA